MPALARLHRHTVTTSLPFVPHLHTPQEDAWWFSERLFATNEVWLAEADGAALGYIAFRPGLHRAPVRRSGRQGAGLGPQLLEMAKAAFAELSLWTFQQNLRARRFYEKHGFASPWRPTGRTTRRSCRTCSIAGAEPIRSDPNGSV